MSYAPIVNAMNDTARNHHTIEDHGRSVVVVRHGLARRYRMERRFKIAGAGAIGVSLAFLVILFTTIFSNGYSAFRQTWIRLDVNFENEAFVSSDLAQADYDLLVKKALRRLFPEVRKRHEKRRLLGLVSSGAAYFLRDMVLENPALIGSTKSVWVPASSLEDMIAKGEAQALLAHRKDGLRLREWTQHLIDEGRLEQRWNSLFFTQGDSREPELAGILGALIGSLYVLGVTMILSLPIGIAAAVYLEEFAPRNRFTDLLEININNLAAVPSVVFGLLGLEIFLNNLGLPRSSSLVGGLVMTMMTLPTIIITARVALQSVPSSIREAALALGASRLQAVFHHVLPVAMPGVLTGAIIGLARAIGESAPLLMIGMVAFIADLPTTITDPATVLPVQIYLWSDSPERGFLAKTSAAVMVLLAFLVLMNGAAIWLRNHFERCGEMRSD